MPDDSFLSFIQRQVREYGTAQRLADSIGMSLSAFSRGVRNQGTLGVESCLRLAEETGESPSQVLRLAGKPQIAELIEKLYGRRHGFIRLGRQERELLALWSTLPPGSQKPLLALMHDLARTRQRGENADERRVGRR